MNNITWEILYWVLCFSGWACWGYFGYSIAAGNKKGKPIIAVVVGAICIVSAMIAGLQYPGMFFGALQ